MAVMNQLEQGLKRAWIPERLREWMEEDEELRDQEIESHAWGRVDPNLDTLKGLEHLFRKVKKIWRNAQTCDSRCRDENAWCMDVIRPLIKLAMLEEIEGRFLLSNVQSQSITEKLRLFFIDERGRINDLSTGADYTLSYSHDAWKSYYTRLSSVPAVSHVDDDFTENAALFSCVQINHTKCDAETRLAVWMTASLCMKMKLAQSIGMPEVTQNNIVEPCFAFQDNHMRVYLAYMKSTSSDDVYFIDHETDLLNCDLLKISDVFRALVLWRNVIRYGMDSGSDGFWGGFMKPLLQGLGDELDYG